MTTLYQITLRRSPEDAGHAHRIVVRMLEDPSRRPLWRLDHRRLVILTDSELRLIDSDLSGLISSVDHKPYQPTVSLADQFLFQVRLTPQKRHQGKLQRRLTLAEIPAFLAYTGARHGFDAVTSRPTYEPGQRFTKKGVRVVLPSLHVQGMLQVTDTNAFHQALLLGIGRHRVYGFGLLQVARTPAGEASSGTVLGALQH